MKNLFTILLALAFCMPALGQDEAAQPKPGFLMFNQNIVAMSDVAKASEMTQEKVAPVLNALVDEGMIHSWGVLTHNWGDDWNWNWYIFAENQGAFLRAWGEAIQRIEEANPGVISEMQELIEEHKDGLYGVRNFRIGAPADGQGPPRFLMLNQGIVAPKDLGRWNEILDTALGPVLDELLAEGLITSWGDLWHAWGDEWNANWWMGTQSHAAFVSAWSELVSRVQARSPGAFAEASALVRRHRDNLYYHAYAYPQGQ